MNILSFFVGKKTFFHSKINGKIDVVEKFGRKTLYVKDVPQSGGEFVFMWREVLRKISDFSFKKCLILGLGGGTVVEFLLKKNRHAFLTVVEIDPVVVKIARKYFSAGTSPSVRMITVDACRFAAREKKKQFDLIIVDLYVGRLNPPETRKEKFLVNLKNLLTLSGRIIYNAHYAPDYPQEFIKFLQVCKANFVEVKEVFQYRYNRVLILK